MDKKEKEVKAKLQHIKDQDKKITNLEKLVSKLIKQNNLHTKSIRSLKANTVRLEAKVSEVSSKLSARNR